MQLAREHPGQVLGGLYVVRPGGGVELAHLECQDAGGLGVRARRLSPRFS